MRITAWLAAAVVCVLLLAQSSHASPFFFTGAVDDDFFNEANWNDQANGTGASLADQGDLLRDDRDNAIGVDLVIDGDTVNADGDIDFGVGSLTINNSGVLNIIDTAADADPGDDINPAHDLDLNAGASLTIDNATLNVAADDAFLQGTVLGVNATIRSFDNTSLEGDITLTGGLIDSGDNIEFSATSVAIDGTRFEAVDDIDFSVNTTGIVNAFFEADSQVRLENVVVDLTNVDISIDGGGNDLETESAGDAGTLILRGASSLVADDIDEGATLQLFDSSTADIGNGTDSGASVGTLGANVNATVTLFSLDASLTVADTPAEAFILNGLTGDSLADAPEQFSVTVLASGDTLITVVPEPTAAALLLVGFAAVGFGPRRKTA